MFQVNTHENSQRCNAKHENTYRVNVNLLQPDIYYRESQMGFDLGRKSKDNQFDQLYVLNLSMKLFNTYLQKDMFGLGTREDGMGRSQFSRMGWSEFVVWLEGQGNPYFVCSIEEYGGMEWSCLQFGGRMKMEQLL